MPDRYGEGQVIAMRAAGHSPRRTGKEFVRNLIGAVVVYAPIAAFLALWPVAPLGGVLIFGAIFVPAVAALITVVGVWAGGDTRADDGGYGRSWREGGYHYGDYPGRGEGVWYGDGGHHGPGDGGHGGGDGGGSF